MTHDWVELAALGAFGGVVGYCVVDFVRSVLGHARGERLEADASMFGPEPTSVPPEVKAVVLSDGNRHEVVRMIRRAHETTQKPANVDALLDRLTICGQAAFAWRWCEQHNYPPTAFLRREYTGEDEA